MLLTVEWPLFYLSLTTVARNTICSEVRVWSVDIGSEIHIEPMVVRGVACFPLAIALLTHVKICIITALRAIYGNVVSRCLNFKRDLTYNSIGLG